MGCSVDSLVAYLSNIIDIYIIYRAIEKYYHIVN